MTAGAAPMVPASPMPFTPSWFVGDGVTVWPSVIDGTSLAAGTRYSAKRRRLAGCRRSRRRASSNSAWARPWIDAAVHLALDDHRVDLDAAVVDGHVLQHVDLTGLGVDLDGADVGAERPREVRVGRR